MSLETKINAANHVKEKIPKIALLTLGAFYLVYG
jgi:hypothetical protein